MSADSYTPLVYMEQGGGELVVKSGGQITAAGTQASAIADVSVATIAWTTGDKAKVNSIIAALEGVGILATS